MKTKDKYDRQIERLVKRPDLIEPEWSNAKGLFQFCTPSGKPETGDTAYGCPVLVKRGYPAWTSELTDRIREDTTIPDSIIYFLGYFAYCENAAERRRTLRPFAVIQRLCDKTIRKKKRTK